MFKEDILEMTNEIQSFKETFENKYEKFIDVPLDELSVSGFANENLKEDTDLIFSALPHKASAEIIGQYVNNDIPVIDFSADFRLPLDIYEKIYDVKHPYPSLIDKFIYG